MAFISSETCARSISHTGSLAGSGQRVPGRVRASGGAVVGRGVRGADGGRRVFAKAPQPKARGVAVLAASGGAAIMAADKAETLRHLTLPQPGEAVRRILEANIPDFGSARNPCDVTGQVVNNPLSMPACSDAFAVRRLRTARWSCRRPWRSRCTRRVWNHWRASITSATARSPAAYLISNWLAGSRALWEPAAERNAHVALFRSMDRCLRTIGGVAPSRGLDAAGQASAK